jgi:cysteine desulfurase
MNRIYLDNNASTKIDPIVLQQVVEELHSGIGNPSSIHREGQQSRKRLNQSRETMARFLNVKPNELIFTSGGSEGASLLINGFIRQNGPLSIISSDVEHSCVYNTLKRLEKGGCQVTYLSTGLWGAVQAEDLERALKPETRLIILMAVNNETGVKIDLHAIGKIALDRGIPLFVDGVSLLGKESFSIPKGVTGMFFSGHKCHAPKGVGVLFLRNPVKIDPIFYGGPQEFNRRAGTENLPGIVGFSSAIELLARDQNRFSEHMATMRDRFEAGVTQNLERVIVNGKAPRVSNTSNLSFLGVNGESLLLMLDNEMAVSHGSACSSGSIEPSRILLKMGVPLSEAKSA